MTADEIMRSAHSAIRDNAANGMVYAHGAVDALLMSGMLTADQHRLWGLSLKTCPGHDDEGGRVWCAYCGDIKQPQPGAEKL